MALNWLEDIVSHLYKLRGYIVLENEDLPTPEGVGGHAEVDIIAIRDRQLVHVECMVWWVPGVNGEGEAFRRLGYKFNQAPTVIFERYALRQPDYEIENIFVTSTTNANFQHGVPWNNLQAWCNDNDIELIAINSVITNLIAELRERYPGPNHVGNEKGIARFLIHLIQNDFLERPQE